MRTILVCAAALVLGCSPDMVTPKAETLCEQTVRAYGPLRDNGPAQAYADLFTKDGSFTLGPNTTTGRAALMARHAASNQTARWQHFMQDVGINVGDAGAITGQTRFLIFTGKRSEKPSAPARQIIGTYHDEFAIVDGSCKIKSRWIEIVFDWQL